MSTNEGDLPDLISSLLDQESNIDAMFEAVMIKPTDWLFAGSIEALKNTKLDNGICVITCGNKDLATHVPQGKARHLHLLCRDKKLGSRDLRKELPKIKAFLGTSEPFNKIYVYCAAGKDLSIGVILAILCLFADDQGEHKRVCQLNA
jgi:tRNA A64-2'-O-ribosylphosphate transferase